MTLEELKSRFDKEVKKEHVKVDWDGGHCYSYIDHPLLNEVDELIANGEITEDVEQDFEDYKGEWLYYHDNEPDMCCTPDCDSDCGRGLDTEGLIGYIERYLELKKKMDRSSKYDQPYVEQLKTLKEKFKIEQLGNTIHQELKQG